MQRKQNKKNEILLCTHGKCEKPQTESGEYCDKHYPKAKNVFTIRWNNKKQALKAITKLENKLNRI